MLSLFLPLPLSLLALTLLTVKALPDFCHADPRVLFHHTQCPQHQSNSHAIFLNYLPFNPYHSVHDHLWALSHYLSHCTTPSEQRFIFAGKGGFDISLCRLPESAAPKTALGLWMPCVFNILAWYNGIPSANLRSYPKNISWPQLTSSSRCFETSVLLGVDPTEYNIHGFGKTHGFFRGMSWFGADCGGTSKQGSCADFQQTTSGVIPLPDAYKRTALRNIRSAVHKYLQVESTVEHGDRINVLIYDRNDTSWRQWTNAKDYVSLLSSDNRLNVRFIRTTPVSFRKQIENFYWADIILAPHGAAMASTIFMRPGADIIEIFTSCDANIIQNRYMPQTWTGWHPYLLDLHLQYVQCHLATGPVKTEEELDLSLDAFYVVTGKPHKVVKEEVMPILNSAVERQVHRVRSGRRFEEFYIKAPIVERGPPSRGIEIGTLDWYHVCCGVASAVVVTFMIAIRKMGRRKKFETD